MKLAADQVTMSRGCREVLCDLIIDYAREEIEAKKMTHDASAKAGFDAGWNAAMDEAAAVVASDLHYTTMELTAMRGDKMVPHHRIAQGSPEHAEALRGLIRK